MIRAALVWLLALAVGTLGAVVALVAVIIPTPFVDAFEFDDPMTAVVIAAMIAGFVGGGLGGTIGFGLGDWWALWRGWRAAASCVGGGILPIVASMPMGRVGS
jgi:hypothetical protein